MARVCHRTSAQSRLYALADAIPPGVGVLVWWCGCDCDFWGVILLTYRATPEPERLTISPVGSGSSGSSGCVVVAIE